MLFRTDKYARVILQRKSRNWRSDAPWNDKIATKIYENLEKKKQGLTNDKILEIERGLPNYIMDFIIPNLELILPKITDEYIRLKLESREKPNETEETTKKENIWKDKYSMLLERVTKILRDNPLKIGQVRQTVKETSKFLGVSITTFSKYYKKSPSDFSNFRTEK